MSAYPFDRFKQIVESSPCGNHSPRAIPKVDVESQGDVGHPKGIAVVMRVSVGLGMAFGEGDCSPERNAGYVADHFTLCAEAMRAAGAAQQAPPIVVTDAEAMVAARAMTSFTCDAFFGGNRKIVDWDRLDQEGQRQVAGCVKASLGAGRFVTHPSFGGDAPGTDPTIVGAMRSCQLQVARLAVLMLRAALSYGHKG